MLELYAATTFYSFCLLFFYLKVGVKGIVAVCEFPDDAEAVIKLSQRFSALFLLFFRLLLNESISRKGVIDKAAMLIFFNVIHFLKKISN